MQITATLSGIAGLARLRGGRFLVLGRVGMDLYPDPPGTGIEDAGQMVAALGGSAGNIAVALARQGMAAALLSAVSDDAVGRWTLRELDRYGVGRAHVRVAGGQARTSLALAETRMQDYQAVIYRNGAADLTLTPQDAEAVDMAGFDALVVTGTALASDPSRAAAFAALDRAGQAGLVRVLDVDWRAYGWPTVAEAAAVCLRAAACCDIVVGNDVEFGLLAGAPQAGEAGLTAARAMAADRTVIYKMGEAGALTLAQAQEVRTGIYPVAAIKPAGAGDAFMGGLLAGLAQGRTLHDATLRGSAAAAVVVARVGCAPAMPDSAALDAFVRDHHPTQP